MLTLYLSARPDQEAAMFTRTRRPYRNPGYLSNGERRALTMRACRLYIDGRLTADQFDAVQARFALGADWRSGTRELRWRRWARVVAEHAALFALGLVVTVGWGLAAMWGMR